VGTSFLGVSVESLGMWVHVSWGFLGGFLGVSWGFLGGFLGVSVQSLGMWVHVSWGFRIHVSGLGGVSSVRMIVKGLEFRV
jgi:hypothetical protein